MPRRQSFKVKDLSLAEDGRKAIEWAESHMPVLIKLRKEFLQGKPLEGWRIGACLHVTKETAVLVRTLKAGGAEIFLCASNPLSTQDNVAAALADEDINVYAWRGETTDEYYQCIEDVLACSPRITMDDGADLVTTIHAKHSELLGHIVGGTEETTTGVTRLRVMAKEEKLGYPIIAVNDAYTKYLFDNRYGTGQSTLDGILRATSILLAGKRLVVAGYGWCGRGIALRARGMGANVTVVEINPLRALEALMDGFSVAPLEEVASEGDIFITATGNIDVIRKEHIEKMKDGVILANAGHFNVEISLKDLEELAVSKRPLRQNVEEYRLRDGRRLYLLAEGRLVNLAAAEGHPPEVMMMSFANQALSVVYLTREGENLKPQVYSVPEEIDQRVAELALEACGVKLERLTEKQRLYLESWKLGTI